MTRRKYTEAEKVFIAAHYATMSRTELAGALDRDPISIKLYLQRNKLSKGGVSATRFQKGNKPWNTGIKGWNPKGSEKAHFKKGHTPHNATGYYDGIVVTRCKKGEIPYRYRRLGKRQWVLSHRYNWEQVNGPIPADYCLKCKTTDTLNDSPGNWELVSRSSLAKRNGIWGAHSAAARLTPNYLASTLTKGRPELREAVLSNPQLLATQEAKITLNRTIKHVLANPIG